MTNPSSPPGAEGQDQAPVQAPQADTGVPACYRHPGRETYVSCVRCGRPACPDCLRSAAVGQQCVECIREANRNTRRPVGNRPTSAPSLITVVWSMISAT